MGDAGRNTPIALFAYDFPHRKSSDFLLDMVASGLNNVTILAAPRKELAHRDARTYVATTLRQPAPYGLRDLCAMLGLSYHVVDHGDAVSIGKIVSEAGCRLGIVGGARIIPSRVIGLFEEGIVNFHPGKIPETSGLDAFFYSIVKDVPSGVTTHFIDGRVDAGFGIWFDEVMVGPDDAVEVVIENGYALQRTCLRRLVALLRNNELVPRDPIDRPSKNHPMTPDEKWAALQKFAAWRARQFQRQLVDAMFRACESGSIVAVKALLEKAPSLLHARNAQHWTPIIVAAFNQHRALVAELLARGASATDSSRKGTTVLMYAKTRMLGKADDDYALLDLIIEAGADVAARDQHGKTVADYVAEAGDERMLAYFKNRMRS